MSKRKALLLAAAVIATVALALGGSIVQFRSALAASARTFRIASRERTISGQRAGEILIGNDVVIRIRMAAGGQSAGERARRVASRLQGLVRGRQVTGREFQVARYNGQEAVMFNDSLVVTADRGEAAANGVSPARLARVWRNNLAGAFNSQVAGYRGETERTSSKIVPIISIGSGVRVGAARISGPESRVHEANVVGQIETEFQKVARIRIFVPLSNPLKLARVPQVDVNAYADLRVIR